MIPNTLNYGSLHKVTTAIIIYVRKRDVTLAARVYVGDGLIRGPIAITGPF